MKTESYSYTFTNGMTVSGTADQILKVAASIGEAVDASTFGVIPFGYYLNSSNELVEIAKMHTQHLVNALLKMTINYFDTKVRITKIKDDIELGAFIENYTKLTENPQIEQMFTELYERYNEAKGKGI